MKKLTVKLMVLLLAQSSLVMSMYRPKPCKGGVCGRRKLKVACKPSAAPAVKAKHGQDKAVRPVVEPTRNVVAPTENVEPVANFAPVAPEEAQNAIADLLNIYMNLLPNEGNKSRDQYVSEIVPVMDEILRLVNPFVDQDSGILKPEAKVISDLFAQYQIDFGIFKATRNSFIEELNLLVLNLLVAVQEANDEELRAALAMSIKDSEEKRDLEEKEDKEDKEKSEDLNNTDLMDALVKAINLPAAQAELQNTIEAEKVEVENAELERKAIAMSLQGGHISGQAKDLNHVETPKAKPAKEYTAGIDRSPVVKVGPTVNAIDDITRFDNQAEDKVRIEREEQARLAAIQNANDALSAQMQNEARSRIIAEQKAREEVRKANLVARLKQAEQEVIREQRLKVMEKTAKGEKPSDITITGGFDVNQAEVRTEPEVKAESENPAVVKFFANLKPRNSSSSSIASVAPAVTQEPVVAPAVTEAEIKGKEEVVGQSGSDVSSSVANNAQDEGASVSFPNLQDYVNKGIEIAEENKPAVKTEQEKPSLFGRLKNAVVNAFGSNSDNVKQSK